MELEKREFRAMIYLHYRESKLYSDSYEILHTVFGDQGPSNRTVCSGSVRFLRGKTNLKDDLRPGRPATAVTQENVDAVERMADHGPRITTRAIGEFLGIGSAAVVLVESQWCENGSSLPEKSPFLNQGFC